MDTEANKALVRKFTNALNSADWTALDDLLAKDFRRHCQATPDAKVESAGDFKLLQESFLTSFPDQHVTFDTLIAEGDKVGFVGSYSGTHLGPLGEIPPTGKKGEVRIAGFIRIDGGRIAELTVEWDNVAFLSQLGLYPPSPEG